MGLFEGKKSPNPVVVRLEAENEALKQEVAFMRKQVDRLQEALIAKESPEAYRTMKADESWLKEGNPATMEKRKKEIEIYTKLMRERESNLFGDVEELISALSEVVGPPVSKPVGDGREG